MHFCHLFLTRIIKFHPALSLFLVSTTVNCFLTFNTFTTNIGPYFPSIVQEPFIGSTMHQELLTGSTCTRNFSQDQHAWGTSHRMNMHEKLFTGSTCKSNFSHINMQEERLIGLTCKRNFSLDQHTRGTSSQDQHARGTSHRINMQEKLFTGSTCTRNFSQDQHARRTPFRINMHENFSQDQHGRGTYHWINMQKELLKGSTCKRTFWSAFGCFSVDVKLYRSTVNITYTSAVNLSFFPLLSTVLLLLYTLHFCCELSRTLDLCMIIFIPNYARPKV